MEDERKQRLFERLRNLAGSTRQVTRADVDDIFSLCVGHDANGPVMFEDDKPPCQNGESTPWYVPITSAFHKKNCVLSNIYRSLDVAQADYPNCHEFVPIFVEQLESERSKLIRELRAAHAWAQQVIPGTESLWARAADELEKGEK
jgi:hypothetical protein